MTEVLVPDLPFLILEEVRNAERYAGALFQRKFNAPIPDYPHHFIALYRHASGALHVASYGHVIGFGDIGLGGGSCTDERVLRLMSQEHRDAIRAAGGLHCTLIKFIFASLAPKLAAIFAYCGDARAELVDLRAGFEKTDTPYLLRKPLQPLHPLHLHALTAKAAAMGPF